MFSKMILDDFRIFKNQTIHIGNTITAIAGQNATGKSTILGILGNACELKSKFGTTITDKQFKTEFSELFHNRQKCLLRKIWNGYAKKKFRKYYLFIKLNHCSIFFSFLQKRL